MCIGCVATREIITLCVVCTKRGYKSEGFRFNNCAWKFNPGCVVSCDWGVAVSKLNKDSVGLHKSAWWWMREMWNGLGKGWLKSSTGTTSCILWWWMESVISAVVWVDCEAWIVIWDGQPSPTWMNGDISQGVLKRLSQLCSRNWGKQPWPSAHANASRVFIWVAAMLVGGEGFWLLLSSSLQVEEDGRTLTRLLECRKSHVPRWARAGR